MRIIITGNLGYVGPIVVEELRRVYSRDTLIGLDTAFFAHCLTGVDHPPEIDLDCQLYCDIRTLSDDICNDADAVVHLAGISNDPIGNAYEHMTHSINHDAGVQLALLAKRAGVRTFVFASSCSVYGFSGEGLVSEHSSINPLTAYAKSKASLEDKLEELADENFRVTCLRFATACGMSSRLRLDLVLNDFVAAALTSGHIAVLSDGTPWRPLIHVRDMARAITWAMGRDATQSAPFLTLNVGSNRWNYRVRDLAEAVAEVLNGTSVSINTNAAPDRRSYSVDFSLFERLAPENQPVWTLRETIIDLVEGLRRMSFSNSDFRNSSLIRLVELTKLTEAGILTPDLFWRSNVRSN